MRYTEGMDMKRGHPWLFERNGTVYLRAKVPIDLVAAMGRKEVKYSLRTREPRKAESLIHGEAAKVQAHFDALRRGTAPMAPSTASEHPARDLVSIAKAWFAEKTEAAIGFEPDPEKRAFQQQDRGD